MRHKILFILCLLAGLMFVNAQTSEETKAAKGYAKTKDMNMYYEIKGEGAPIILLHGAYMTMEGMMREYATELSKTRKVIMIEFQGHGRTPDVKNKDITYEGLADDIAILLKYLKIDSTDILGYSLGAGVALQMTIRHSDMINKVICLSGSYSDEGFHPAFKSLVPTMTEQVFEGTSFKREYDSLAPNTNDFPILFQKLKKLDMSSFNWEKEYMRIKKPMLLIFGDGDIVTVDHIADMVKKLDGNQPADLGYKSNVQLAVLPNTSHVDMMKRFIWINPMVKEFLK